MTQHEHRSKSKRRRDCWKVARIFVSLLMIVLWRSVAFRRTANQSSELLISAIAPDEKVPEPNHARQRINRTPKVYVVTVWSHYPDMMEIHVASFRAFLRQKDFEYIAVLNSHDPEVNAELLKTAEDLNVIHLTVEQSGTHDSSYHHSEALNQVLHSFLLNSRSPIRLRDNDFLWLVDGDIFLTESTNLVDLLQGAPILSMPQTRADMTYLWPNFLLMRLDNWKMYRDMYFQPMVTSFEGGEQVSLDSGGTTLLFLRKYPHLRPIWLAGPPDCLEQTKPICGYYHGQQKLPRNDTLCRAPEILQLAECSQNCTVFYHIGSAGSNWRGCPESFMKERRRDYGHFLKRLS